MQIRFLHREICPLCASPKRSILSEIPYRNSRLSSFLDTFYRGRVDLEALGSESYRIVTCECGFIFQDPVLDDNGMLVLYRDWIDHEASLKKKQTASAKLFRQYAGQLHSLARLFDKRPDQTRVLEYGMGWGYWSRMAQAHGFDVVGYELSPQRVEYARQMGIRVIDSLPSESPGFDCIFANQVFEHLPEPLQTLQELCRHLRPGGFVYIRVPDGRGVAGHLRQKGWSPALDAIHPLEHINCFTRNTLIMLGDNAGLKPFNPPLRINLDSFWGGLKRELADRLLTTHLFLRC
ncbi:MAG: class I SAM-dependent methyltransferase [Gammaproteobacteria bacterium]|nr:class I SAM-dependent methyltransferase [Gammaproteobacteria bacterium]